MANSRKEDKKETVAHKDGERAQEQEPLTREEEDFLLDEANEDTFPASDPPSTSPMTSLGKPASRKVPVEKQP